MTGPVGLATIVWGDGPRRALLLHGLTSAGSTWWRVGPALASLGYTVVAPDLRGHGKSPAGDDLSIESYRDDVMLMGRGWDLLLGHSLGGTIAGTLVEADAGFAERVVYEDPAADWELASEFILESPQRVGKATIAGVAAEHPDWSPDDVRYKVEALNSCRHDVEAKTVSDVAPRDIWSKMVAADVPSLVIAADPDVVSLVSAAQEAEAVGTSLRVVRVRGAGHSIHRDAPDRFVELLTEFVTAPLPARQAG